MARELYILYGVASPYARDVAEIVIRCGGGIVAFVHNFPDSAPPEDLHPLVGPGEIAREWLEHPVLLPLVTPGHRSRLRSEVLGRGFETFGTVVHPEAAVATTAEFGAGVSINAGSVIASRVRLAEFTLVNRSASVGHDVEAAEYVTIGPGVVICGGCRLEPGCFLGAGAVLNPGISVGKNSVVGAGSVVLEDVPAHTLAVGNPARIVRRDAPGYNGVSVP